MIAVPWPEENWLCGRRKARLRDWRLEEREAEEGDKWGRDHHPTNKVKTY
jgi:hypothetical protein